MFKKIICVIYMIGSWHCALDYDKENIAEKPLTFRSTQFDVAQIINDNMCLKSFHENLLQRVEKKIGILNNKIFINNTMLTLLNHISSCENRQRLLQIMNRQSKKQLHMMIEKMLLDKEHFVQIQKKLKIDWLNTDIQDNIIDIKRKNDFNVQILNEISGLLNLIKGNL